MTINLAPIQGLFGEVSDLNYGLINIKDYGAQPASSLTDTSAMDCTPALEAARDAGGPNSTIIIPAGIWRFTGGTRFAYDSQRLIGVGRNATQIMFDPPADNSFLWEWASLAYPYAANVNQVSQCSVENMGFYSNNTTYTKQFIRQINVSNFHCINLLCFGLIAANYHCLGGNSVFIVNRGREQCLYRGIQVYGIQPFAFGRNPNTVDGNFDQDQFVIEDFFGAVLADQKALMTHPCCLVRLGNNTGDADDDSGDTRISTIKFMGHQSWIGGDYGLYWQADTLTQHGGGIFIEDLIDEQALLATGHTVHIDIANGQERAGGISMKDSALSVERQGIYTNNAEQVALENVAFTRTDAPQLVMTGDPLYAPKLLTLKDCNYVNDPYEALIQLPEGMVLSSAEQLPFGSLQKWPHTATWTRNTSAQSARPEFAHGDMWHYARQGSLADYDTAAGNAVGAKTATTAYNIGTTVIILTAVGAGAINAGDVITLEGDPHNYVVSVGDADVSGGGSIQIYAPGLRQKQIGGVKVITILSVAGIQVPVNANQRNNLLAFIDVMLTSTNPAGSVMQTAHYVVAPNASGANGITMLTGSANMVAGSPANGQASISCAAANTADMMLINRLGETCNYLIHARFAKSVNN